MFTPGGFTGKAAKWEIDKFNGNVIGTSVRHFSWSAFGRLTVNDVSDHYKQHYFFFLRCLLFSLKEWLDQTTYLE